MNRLILLQKTNDCINKGNNEDRSKIYNHFNN